jgi:hypothetical protein
MYNQSEKYSMTSLTHVTVFFSTDVSICLEADIGLSDWRVNVLLEMFLDCCSLFEVSEARGWRGETEPDGSAPANYKINKL